MANRDDWTWSDWGRASIGWRLRVIGRGAGRLLVMDLKSPFLAIRAAHPAVKAAEPWGILLAVIALGLSLVAFWIDYSDRVEKRTVRAWQLLTTKAPGNSGKIAALEYLDKEDGLLCGDDGCLLTLKYREPLVGINLSNPEPEQGTGAFLFRARLPNAILWHANLRGAS